MTARKPKKPRRKPRPKSVLAWLHQHRDRIILGVYRGKVTACATSAVGENVHAEGETIEESLRRLVVAVKAKEAKR